ncbi:MAG TPA: YIEGIA family protein [Bacillus sp. (in: firmicutes)]|uniref:YIEGIA family protein n=1 Tax=Bacillus litorisediminis TaxID=2922713 RepID=UPI001FAD6925|nr:YIEGIA family protein [Bacillus litorisediminis]HWO75853.1 YIEGIA family protein [Bacillus sp. (in: firmicutes)]
MNEYLYPVIYGLATGILARLYMLRTDYRQYPTYLHGKIIHIALGVIASGLGTIAIPALLEEEYTAITFLTVAASQFREVRNMERNTLTELDTYELVPRGKTYIEGIAVTFESRNYLVILASMLSTLIYVLFGFYAAIGATILIMIGCKIWMDGGRLGEIVEIEFSQPHFKGAGLYVGDIYIMNIGIPEKQELILKYGMGFILTPKDFNAMTTIANIGQRQAILHDVSTALGVFSDTGEPSLVPLAKRNLDDGRLGVFVLPQVKNIEAAIKIIEVVPILENSIRMPTKRHVEEEERRTNL